MPLHDTRKDVTDVGKSFPQMKPQYTGHYEIFHEMTWLHKPLKKDWKEAYHVGKAANPNDLPNNITNY